MVHHPQSLIPEPFTTYLYLWGSGSGGALGLNQQGNVRKLEVNPIPAFHSSIASRSSTTGSSLQNNNIHTPTNGSSSSIIRMISAGYQKSSIITADHECYTWGNGDIGRKSKTLSRQHTPGKIQCNELIQKIVLGQHHSVILTSNGKVLCFGDLSNGKCGYIGNKTDGNGNKKCSLVPIELPLLLGRKSTDVACGDSSTTILLDDGVVVMFGLQSSKRHHKKECHQNTKKKHNLSSYILNFPIKINAVSSGAHHCAAISDNHDLYTWGINSNGRLGQGDADSMGGDFCEHPKRVEYFHLSKLKVNKVCCGAAHTCVVTNNEYSRLFSFGWNLYFQCGVGEKEGEDISIPCEVYFNVQNIITDISCGFAHSAVVTASGELFTWGFNEEGQLGLGHEKNASRPTLVNFDKVDNSVDMKKYAISVSCGQMHTLCIMSNCLPSQVEERYHIRDLMLTSLKTLIRFGRYVLLRKRLQKISQDAHKKQKQIEVCEVSQNKTDERIDYENEVEASSMTSSSSDDVLSNFDGTEKCDCNNIDQKLKNDEESSFLSNTIQQELYQMELEDKLSRKAQDYYINMRKSLLRKFVNICIESFRQKEIQQLAIEDSAANTRRELQLKIDRERKNKHNRKVISDRKAKSDLYQQREVQRMLNAKQTREKQREGKLLPPIRRVRNKKQPLQPRKNEMSINNANNDGSQKEQQNRIRNEKLLQRRQVRMEQKNQKENEEKMKRMIKLKEEQQKLEERRRYEQYLEEEEKRLKRLFLERHKLSTTLELLDMKKSLVLKKSKGNSVENKNAVFRSVAQWSRDLGGG